MPHTQQAPLSPSEIGALRRVQAGRPNAPHQRDRLIGLKLIAFNPAGRIALTLSGLARLELEPAPAANSDLIVMLVGLGVLVAGSGIIPYVASFF